ncbi:MAG: DinB family protein [Bacteroidota bacterium]
MNYDAAITQLNRNKAAFVSLMFNLPPAEYNWRRTPDTWNLLEIVCHLRDEEVEDFRPRTRICLESPGTLPPPIAPDKWPEQRAYLSQNYLTTMANFLDERSASITWLQSLEAPDWDRGFDHPEMGHLTAGLLLRNWVMHDYLHLQKAQNIRMAYLRAHSPDGFKYATGE